MILSTKDCLTTPGGVEKGIVGEPRPMGKRRWEGDWQIKHPRLPSMACALQPVWRTMY
jgi:hypothetical protein